MLAGYGEIEFNLAAILGYVLQDRDRGIRAYFRLVSERSRLDSTDALIRAPLTSMKLGNEYGVALGAIRACHGMRNKLAHSHWGDHHDYPGLWYTNAQEAAQGHLPLDFEWFHLDETLLQRWEDYFIFTQRCLFFINHRVRYQVEKLKSRPPGEWPAWLSAPPEHNPPEEHVPPWLPLKNASPPEELPAKRTRGAKRAEKADRKAKWKKGA